MLSNFIILRSVDKTDKRSFESKSEAGSNVRSLKVTSSRAAAPVQKLKVEIDQLTPQKVVKLLAKKEILSVVPAMPMKLIKPLKGKMPAKTAAVTHSWGIEATGAFTSQFTGDGITVAVLDTGIHEKHPAFQGVKFVTKDFTGEGITDIIGHGTHCAGTIFGRNVGGVRIGVAPGIKSALIGKVLSANGGGSDMIASAIIWAVDNGADIISMSLGINFPGYVQQLVGSGLPVDLATSKALEAYRANILLFEKLADYVNAISAFTKSTILVAAAGNESRREKGQDYVIGVSPPAVSEGFISVGALGLENNVWSIADFSNTGPQLCGPGVDILSADLKTGLTSFSGTSMATPHVAGVAALWAQKIKIDGLLNAKTLSAKLLANANVTGLKKGYDVLSVGSGMVQAPQK